MPNNVPGNIHYDASVPCPEHALTPTPPPSPPPPPYEITNAAGECFILIVSEDCQHHGFTNVLDAGECERFAAAVGTGTGTSIDFILRTNNDYPNGCNAYTTDNDLDMLTYWNDKPDPNTQGHLGIIVDPDSNSDLPTTNNLVCRCPRPPPPPSPPAPPAPPPPSPQPPPRPPPPRLYAGGGCAFYTNGAASDPGVRVKKSGDSGLSVSGSVNQPLIAVGSTGGPSTSSEWLTLVADKGQGDAEENGAGVLFFQVTVDNSGRGAPNSAVTNARCVELCDWWDKCVTYEYFKWDGGRPCGDNSPGGCEHAGAYMRCELWIYPRDASVYSASEEHVNDVWCGAAGNGPHSGDQAPQNWPDLDDPTLKFTQPWPPVFVPTIPMYALVAPDTRCDLAGLAGFTSFEWKTDGQSYLSCCSDIDNWSGTASGQTFGQLRANCEAACNSGVHGQCNVITYYSDGASCNLGYYDGLVRTTLVDSVLNDECEDATGRSMWVVWPEDAYRLVGAGKKCDIHTLATWEGSGNNFHPCCAAHDGGPATLADPLIHKTFTLSSGTVDTVLIPMDSCDAAGTHAAQYSCEQAYDEPANHVFDGTNNGDTLYHSATTCDAGDHNWVAFYFAEPQDIAVIEVVNRGSNSAGFCCGLRLQDHEIYYCTNGATNEAGCDWTLCSTYSGDTTHGQVINHACNAPGATGFKLKQPCHGTDSYLNIHAAKAYAVSAFAYQNFEQLKVNCEAACDGWAATSGRGSCNVITYQDRTRCELGHYDGGLDVFEQRIANGDCSSNARYDTYVRNTPAELLMPTACFIDNENPSWPCTGCYDGETEHIHTLFGCGTGQINPAGHFVDIYFPAADISHLVIHNRKGGNCYGTHCSYRLGSDGWEVWYLPTSKGDGAYVEGTNTTDYPYVEHWVKCFETDVSTLNELVLQVDCVASDVFAIRIVQKYWDNMNLNEIEVYGTALPQPDNCVLSGAAHPVTGHDCNTAPSGAGSTGDAFCRDTGHGGCPGAWCDGVGSGKCAQNTR